MTPLDRYLQNRRLAMALPYIPPGGSVLDIGTGDGILFDRLKDCPPNSLGIDPTLKSETRSRRGIRLIPGYFPADLPPKTGTFDAIVMLAVLEHIPTNQFKSFSSACHRMLRPGGRVIITVPSPQVDNILEILITLRLVHGMSVEEHHGFDVRQTPSIFGPPLFRQLERRTFQLGLNNLFVFERSNDPVELTPARPSVAKSYAA